MNNTAETVKTISRWAMLIGGTLFTAGFSANFIVRRIEKGEYNKERDAKLLETKIEHDKEMKRLDEEARQARIEKDRLYSERIQGMDKKEFAKFHAEAIARANDDVIARAERIRKDSEAAVAEARMKATDEIAKIREECVAKIEAAIRKQQEAEEKYHAIDILFTNRNKILAAKEELEKMAKKETEDKETREKIMKMMANM